MRLFASDVRGAGRRTAQEIAQAVLTFILVDRQRLAQFLDSADIDPGELRMGMTSWLALRVLQHVIDNDELRDLCVAAGVFRATFEQAATARATAERPFRGTTATVTLPTYH